MEPTGILVQEHREILQALESFATAKAALETGGRPDPHFFETGVRFFSAFADRFHHFKEEFLMFGLLAQKKNGAVDLEIGALRFQHERCRIHLDRIHAALGGYSRKDEIATTTLLENLAAYEALLRRHIHLEDTMFFPMIQGTLTSEEKVHLRDYFQNEEKRFRESGALETCLSDLNLLKETHIVSRG